MKLPKETIWNYKKRKFLKNPNIVGVARRQSQLQGQRRKERLQIKVRKTIVIANMY